MDHLLLTRPELKPGYIDFNTGEATIIREALFEAFPIRSSFLCHLHDKSDYPHPSGYQPLVKWLEDQYKAPVIITNGAKQALGAVFHALAKLGKTTLGMRSPFWPLIPPLARHCGLTIGDKYDAYLAILPNNPDGYMVDYEYAKYLSSYHRYFNIPFIHDAVYYTDAYMPKGSWLGPLGDVQIYSASKMFGLSGLRIGWAVVHNKEYYKLIQEYVEMTTVGVSIASQDYLLKLFQEIRNDQAKYRLFLDKAKEKLYLAKALMKTLKPEVLVVPDNIMDVPGIFAWCGVGPKCNFEKAKVHAVSGEAFGDKSKVRLNLGLSTSVLLEAIERLNNV
jgi:aspartate/methionine/tyrosine aminotransferase